MIINFRQGIVSYPTTGGVQQFLTSTGNYVALATNNGPVDVAFAHKNTNYLHTESSNVPNAWGPFADSVVWLYWDLDTMTAVRTFGSTSLRPIAQPSAPASPSTDQHWFDTSVPVMKVWTGSRWQEKIRVFAAEYDPTTHAYTSISVLSNQERFDGTQAGLQGTNTPVGRIIADNAKNAVKDQYGQFLTTEDDFFVNGSPINAIRMEANILTAKTVETVAAYQVVTFSAFDTVRLANYDDLQTSAIAIAVQNISGGDVGSFVIQGVITNPAWDWPSVGAELWVSSTGQLIDSDPHTTSSTTYVTGKAPIGRVLSRTSIIFDQGLGGKGDKGDSALAGQNDMATMTVLGKVKLSHEPTDVGSPIAVETTDPRMSDARTPLQHTQPASTIIPDPVGTNVTGTLQDTLNNIENAKLNKTGDQMTGALLLNGNPTQALAAAPKQYVDAQIAAQKGVPLGNATLDASGKIPSTQLPPIALSDTFVVGSQSDMLALSAQTGDLAVRTDVGITYILKGTTAGVLSDWQELLTKPDGVMWIDVVPAGGQHGIVTSGGPVTSNGTISISLANDLLALENLNNVGVAHRTGLDTWELKAVDLAAGGQVVTGVLPMLNGGTGLPSAVGYLKGNGNSYTAMATIPGADVSGSVPSASSVNWSGVTNRPTNLIGYGISDAYTKTQTDALLWNWSSIINVPSTLAGYGITDVYSKSETDARLAQKATNSTTLAGYGITDAAPIVHQHSLDDLTNVNTSVKANGDVLSWNGSNWSPVGVGNAILPPTFSNKTIDASNTYIAADDKFTVVDNVDATKSFTFQASAISTGTNRVYTMPNASGTFVLGDGTGASGTWNITAATATNVLWTDIASKPTTVSGYGITDAYTKAETNALTWTWSSVTTTPTTLSGYGIGDAYTKAETDAKTWNWSTVTSTPTTVSGYGITDAYTKTEIDAKAYDWSSIINTPTTLAGYGITDVASSTHDHDTVYVKIADVGTTVPSLVSGTVPESQLPAFARSRVFTAADDLVMISLQAHTGDIATRTDQNKMYILSVEPASILSNWTPLVTSTAGDNVFGTVSIANGGTGATTAPAALASLGATPLDGTGANGNWNINAATVTNGVYTTSSYTNPAWISSLDPSKVVSTWQGSANINTLSANINYGDVFHQVTGVVSHTGPGVVLVHMFDDGIYDGGKYLIYVKSDDVSSTDLVEILVSTDNAGNVYINQVSAGTDTITFTAVRTGGTVSITATPTTQLLTTFRYTATLFAKI